MNNDHPPRTKVNPSMLQSESIASKRLKISNLVAQIKFRKFKKKKTKMKKQKQKNMYI